jgi:pimeloyl-ACP methyl ester carboxylesterase
MARIVMPGETPAAVPGYDGAMKTQRLIPCLLALAAASCRSGADLPPIVLDLSAGKTPAATATPSPLPKATPTPPPAAAAVAATPAPPVERLPPAPTVVEASAPAYDPELTNYDYPRPVQVFALHDQRQDLKMACILAEPSKPNGRTVLLLHGKNFSAAYWEPTIRALLGRGFRVVAPDQIGFGKSSKPAAYQFTFQALARNTRALLDALKVGKVSVVGHSMGGMLAARFALMYPETTETLVLVNPIGLEDWKTAVPSRSVDELYQSELKATPESIRAYEKENYFAGNWKPEYEPLIAIPAGWTRHPDYSRVAWNAALTTDMVFTQPVLYEFPLIKARTLLIIGQRDRTAVGKAWASEEARRTLGDYPVLGRRAARAIPGARLVEVKDAGHLPQVEAFDTYIKAVLDFLGS